MENNYHETQTEQSSALTQIRSKASKSMRDLLDTRPELLDEIMQNQGPITISDPDTGDCSVYELPEDAIEYTAPIYKSRAIRCVNSADLGSSDKFKFRPCTIIDRCKFAYAHRYKRITDAEITYRPLIQAGTGTTGYIVGYDDTLQHPERTPLLRSQSFDLGRELVFQNFKMTYGIDTHDTTFPLVLELKLEKTAYKSHSVNKEGKKKEKKKYGTIMCSYRVESSPEPLPTMACVYTVQFIKPVLSIEDKEILASAAPKAIKAKGIPSGTTRLTQLDKVESSHQKEDDLDFEM